MISTQGRSPDYQLHEGRHFFRRFNIYYEGKDFRSNLNPDSLEKLTSCRLEPCLADAKSGDRYQFERMRLLLMTLIHQPVRRYLTVQ